MERFSGPSVVIEHYHDLGYRVVEGNMVAPPNMPRYAIYLDHEGYVASSLPLNGVWMPVKLHCFLAYQLYGDKIYDPMLPSGSGPFDRCQRTLVCHKNDIKTDLRPENIVLGNNRDNSLDAAANNRIKRAFSDEQILIVQKDRKDNNLSYKQLERKYGIASAVIRHALTGHTELYRNLIGEIPRTMTKQETLSMARAASISMRKSFTTEQALSIRNEHRLTGISYRQLSFKYNVSDTVIRAVCLELGVYSC